MNHLFRVALLAFAPGLLGGVHLDAAATAQEPGCLRNRGVTREYGPPAQLRDIQSMLRRGDCRVIALTWTLQQGSVRRQSLFIYDVPAARMARVTQTIAPVRRGIEHETWIGATRRVVLADDPKDGFHVGRRRQGRGPARVTSRAAAFVGTHATPKSYATFLTTPVPAGAGP